MDSRKSYIWDKIRTIPNYPKKGIMFRDVTTLLSDSKAMNMTTDFFLDRYGSQSIDYVAGIEARGFIFGGILADRLDVGFIPIRKKGKLPYETISVEYSLEYGDDKMEMHIDSIKKGDRVLVVDDLIATGGTAEAACKLIEKLDGEVVGNAFVVELPELSGRERLSNWGCYSIISFEGH